MGRRSAEARGGEGGATVSSALTELTPPPGTPSATTAVCLPPFSSVSRLSVSVSVSVSIASLSLSVSVCLYLCTYVYTCVCVRVRLCLWFASSLAHG